MQPISDSAHTNFYCLIKRADGPLVVRGKAATQATPTAAWKQEWARGRGLRRCGTPAAPIPETPGRALIPHARGPKRCGTPARAHPEDPLDGTFAPMQGGLGSVRRLLQSMLETPAAGVRLRYRGQGRCWTPAWTHTLQRSSEPKAP